MRGRDVSVSWMGGGWKKGLCLFWVVSVWLLWFRSEERNFWQGCGWAESGPMRQGSTGSALCEEGRTEQKAPTKEKERQNKKG